MTFFIFLAVSYSAFRLSGQRMKGLAAYKVNFLWSWMDSLLGKVRSISAAQNCGPFKCNALYYLNFAGLHNSRDVIAFVRVCRWSSWLTVTNDRRPYGLRTNDLLVAWDQRPTFFCAVTSQLVFPERRVASRRTCLESQMARSPYRVSHLVVDLGRVGLTLIWVFHHIA